MSGPTPARVATLTAATGLLVTSTGHGDEGPPTPAVRVRLSVVALSQTSVVARRGQTVATISGTSLASGTRVPSPSAGSAGSTYVRDAARYALRDTAVSRRVVDDPPAVVAPTGRRGSVEFRDDLP